MQVTTVGLDLAKNIFHIHGVTETGELAFNRPLRRAQVLACRSPIDPNAHLQASLGGSLVPAYSVENPALRK